MAGGLGAQGIVIAVLGAPRIERDGRAVTFDTRKAVALLGYLATTGRPQRRETLAALLWPDADETHAHLLHDAGRGEEAMEELKRAVAIFADIGAEGGSVQTEVWRLSEWADQASGPIRNDSGTVERDNAEVAPGPTARMRL